MRLIDADELNKRFESSCTTECACCPYSDDNCGLVHEADTVNAIVIPEGATNGDVIKALFPNIKINDIDCLKMIYTGIDYKNMIGFNLDATKEWWNAPYMEVEE